MIKMLLNLRLHSAVVLLLLLLLLVSVMTMTAGGQDDTFSCGGFIRSKIPISFEKIKIKLLTASGNLKAETDGIADFGYYLLPVYEKGQYQLRVEGPTGWTFDPPAVDIHLNGEDPCSQNRDINFEFKGFSIIGKVSSKGSTDPPAGIDVTLVEAGSTRTLKTLEGGNFVFPAVTPGTYKMKFRGEIAEVRVENDTVRLSDSLFVIEGYSLKGKINSHLPKVTASVVLTNKESIPCCGRSFSKDLPKGFVLPEGQQLSCVVKTSVDGFYEFPCVRAAPKYVIFAHVVTQFGQVVDTSPSRVEFDVLHSDTSIQVIEVIGFPVSGIVKNVGRNVEITIVETGREVYTEDDGSFKLGSLRSGTYTLRLRKNGFYFEDRKITVDPTTTTLSDIYPDKFQLCGDVRVSDSVEIEITNTGTNEVVEARSDVSSGRFCAFVGRGEHMVRPKYTVRLSPWEIKVEVPLPSGHRLVFSQFTATVNGKINCLDTVCAGFKVSLNGVTSNAKSIANSNGAFVFKNVEPGTYEACVSHGKACFEKDCQSITVIDANIDNVQFVQKGHLLRLESSHETELEIGGSIIKVKSGLSIHCVTATKAVPIKSVGCHRFAKEDKLVFNPNSEDVVVLKAESHRLQVEISSKLLVKDLELTCTNGEQVQLVKLKEYEKLGELFVHVADFYYPKGVEVVLEPRSDSLVFKPPQLTVRTADDCTAISISGEIGIFIEGLVKPPLADVRIIVATNESSKPCQTLTDANGTYRAGPLQSQEYTIEAHKEGYGFERIANSNDLIAVKYSRIVIKVVDDKDNSPLAGALVMIAGAQEYRNVTKTGDRGDLSLIKLNPGDYYVKVVMKEYKFEPLSTMVSVSENSEELLLIRGKKIAYSVVGKITSITGEVENGVTLEAVSEECDRHEEDAKSDETGTFRIRGLRNGCSYEIRLKRVEGEAESNFERILPATQQVTIDRSDITLNLVVIRPIKTTTFSVSVRADPALLATLRVVLYHANRQLFNLPATGFAIFPSDVPLDGSAYQLEVQQQNSKLPSHLHVVLVGSSDSSSMNYSSLPTVLADRPYRHLELEVRVDEKTATSQGQPPAPGSPFVAVVSVFVALAIFYRKELAVHLLRHRQDNSSAAADRRKNRIR